MDDSGFLVAHGADASLVGRFVDTDGRHFVTEMMEVATAQGARVDYHWEETVTGNVESKSGRVVRHDGHVFGVGIYTP